MNCDCLVGFGVIWGLPGVTPGFGVPCDDSLLGLPALTT